MHLIERQTVIDACRELADRGYLPGTGGNVSLRVTNKLLAVTPSASDYYSMSADDICVVDLATGQKMAGTGKPSVETGIHRRMLLYRTDFNACVHTHQPVASAVTLLNVELPMNDPEDQRLLGPVAPLVGYAPSGTWFLARAFGKKLRKDASAYLLKNHGIVCGGKSMREAIDNVDRLERSARVFLARRIADRPGHLLSARVLEMLESSGRSS